MPERFPPLSRPKPDNRVLAQLLQALPLGELSLCLLIGLVVLLA